MPCPGQANRTFSPNHTSSAKWLYGFPRSRQSLTLRFSKCWMRYPCGAPLCVKGKDPLHCGSESRREACHQPVRQRISIAQGLSFIKMDTGVTSNVALDCTMSGPRALRGHGFKKGVESHLLRQGD